MRYPTETNDGSQTWLRLRYDNGTTQIVPLGRGAFDSATQAIWAQHAVSDLIPSGAMGLEVEVYSLAPGATLPEAGLDKATAEQSLRGLSSYRMTKHPSTGEWQIAAIPNSAAQTKRETFTVTHTPTQSFAYDRWGSRIAATDALGVTTHWHYNQYGQVTDQVGAVVARVNEHGKIEWAAQTNHYRYNEFGELRYSIDGNGDVSRFDYNRLGSKTAQGYLQRSNQAAWANDGRSVRDGYFVAAQNWRYDELGRLAAHQSNTALAETRYSYNALDKIIRSEQQGSSWVLNADNDGTTMQDYTAVVDYRYNGAGQREVETRYRADQPLNKQELHQRYDAADRVIQNQNKEYRDGNLVSSGLLRSYRYNELGNKIAESVTGTIKTTASDGTVTYSTPTDTISWTYENGQMIRSTDLANNITTHEYNSAGERIRITQSRDGGAYVAVTDLRYNTAGHLVHQAQLNSGANNPYAAPREQFWRYDAAGRVIVESYKEVVGSKELGWTQSTRYDAAGRIEEVSGDGIQMRYWYDGADNRRVILGASGANGSWSGVARWNTYDELGRTVITGGQLDASKNIVITAMQTQYGYGLKPVVFSTEVVSFVNFVSSSQRSINSRQFTYLGSGGHAR